MPITETLGQGLIFFFTKIPLVGSAMAAFLALGLMIAAVWICLHYKKKYVTPLLTALEQRIAGIEQASGGPDADIDVARESFAKNFNDIDAVMMGADHEQSFALRRTWEEYRETIVDTSAEVLQNTARPEQFFLHLAERQRGLNWFANIFIAVGLLITFLGIIAALSTLDFSGSVDAMQQRLNDLMKVAGAKFWASVGGIVASIILRAFDYKFGKNVDGALFTLCDKLEHGMIYLPPQRIASDQLEQLREQTPALRTFSEQLAVALDGALEKQMGPMIAHLGSIQDGIDKISGGGGEAVSQAIANGAGAEMAGLAEAIGGMTLSMATMAERLDKQTGEADRQIEEAVRRFGQASEEMRGAFGELNKNFEAVAERMRTESEAVSAQSRAQLEALLGTLGSTLDGMKDGLAEAASKMGNATSQAANDAARIGRDALEDSFGMFAKRFAEAGSPLIASMKEAGETISESATGLKASQTAIGDHARSIEGVARNSTDLAAAFGTVANDVRLATTPVRESAGAIERAVQSVEELMSAEARSNEAARDELKGMAEALRNTATAAEAAWADYKARFNEVDRSLAAALNQITDATSSHAQNLNERVGQIDSALGKGVAQLAGALEPLSTLRDTVEELASVMVAPARVAAE